jgi:guanylate kinase
MSSDRPGRGKLIVISGPSGTGKTSICNALLARDPGAVWSVSATTRPPRGQEKSGSSYEYISREEFDARRERGEFLEWAEYVGHLYGTPAKPVDRALEAGNNVIMEIDVQGGAQVAERVPESIRVFVLPPTMESLKARLEGRHTESAEQLTKRLAEADGEIGFARDSGRYRHFVVNDVLEDTVAEIEGIIRSETESVIA